MLPETGTYDPYPSPDFAGDVDAAKAEMAQSRYDSDGDGLCDADVCNDVLIINRNYDPFTKYTPILQASLEQIGIHVKIRELDISTAYTTIQTLEQPVPMSINASWGKDYASPYGFDFFLFNTAGIACTGAVTTPTSASRPTRRPSAVTTSSPPTTPPSRRTGRSPTSMPTWRRAWPRRRATPTTRAGRRSTRS